jgi:hypothetical protein
VIPLSGPTRTTALALRVDAVAAEVTGALAEAGIRAILLKGASFADWLYRDGSQRPYQDVDLLVAPACFEATIDVLRDCGFRDRFVGPQALTETWFRPHDPVPVDLHRSLRGTGVSPTSVWERLSDTTETLRVGTRNVEVLSEPARAFHVAHNAFKDKLKEGSSSRRDLSLAVSRVDLETWRAAARLAESLEAVPWFVVGLCVIPEGRVIAERLDLPIESATHSAWKPPGPRTSVEQLIATQGLAARARLIGRRLLPTATEMRLRSRLANRGMTGLALAYLWRMLLLPIRLPRAALAWRRARAGATE